MDRGDLNELQMAIDKRLNRLVARVAKRWEGVVQVSADLKKGLGVMARTPPTDSKQFMLFLLDQERPFYDAILLKTLPAEVVSSVTASLLHRAKILAGKEKAVAEHKFEEAAKLRDDYEKASEKLGVVIAAHQCIITLESVKAAFEELGWSDWNCDDSVSQ